MDKGSRKNRRSDPHIRIRSTGRALKTKQSVNASESAETAKWHRRQSENRAGNVRLSREAQRDGSTRRAWRVKPDEGAQKSRKKQEQGSTGKQGKKPVGGKKPSKDVAWIYAAGFLTLVCLTQFTVLGFTGAGRGKQSGGAAEQAAAGVYMEAGREEDFVSGLQTDNSSDVQRDAQQDPQTNLKPDAQPDPQAGLTPDAQQDPQANLKPDAQQDPQADPQPDAQNLAAEIGTGQLSKLLSEPQTETETETEKERYEDKPDLDISDWQYILANSWNSIGEYTPELTQFRDVEIDWRIYDDMNAFVTDAESQGYTVVMNSGYRSYETQSWLFAQKTAECGGDEEMAATIVARPGTSEHQTGLAADITDGYYEYMNDFLEQTPLYQWMSKHCHEYGFIVRFPKGKEGVTGIIYEPWHYRYVGKEAAGYIMEHNLTLEEFIDLYA